MIPSDTIRAAPKVLLHDHLDGGLRPTTVIDLAREFGYAGLPTTDADELAASFTAGADRKSLVLYLEGFEHTVGVLQAADALERVAFECAADLAEDGVVYAEVRYAPELSTHGGLTLDEVVQAILRGFARGEAETGIRMGFVVTAMRQFARSVEIAELAIRYRDDGVVGFDVAGPEAGYPPTRYLDAFNLIHQANFHLTIHAGEAFGLPSIWEALQWCGAHRLGHGVRIVDDIFVDDDGQLKLGRLATYVRDQRVLTLEDAIRKFTALPAQRMRFTDRGVLKEGLWADIVVFDSEQVRDLATFEKPRQLSVGMEYVLVNGVPVIADGKATDALPGQVLRGQGYVAGVRKD